jgi:DNA-binding CsgD family transcriptional regulator
MPESPIVSTTVSCYTGQAISHVKGEIVYTVAFWMRATHGIDGRVPIVQDTKSLSTGHPGKAPTRAGTTHRTQQPLVSESSLSCRRRPSSISSQLFSRSSADSQAAHAEWKQQILQDVASCLDLPSDVVSEGFSLLQAREQALLDAIDRLILSIYQDVQYCLDVQAQAAREVDDNDDPTLTRQQIAVLEQLSIGRTPKEIARHLGVEVATIRAHQRAAYARLGVSGRAAAVRAARLRGLLSPRMPGKSDEH